MRICDYRVGFVGFGHMAQILFRSMDKAKLIPRSQILFTRRDPAKIKKSEQEFHITSTTLETLLEKSDLIFLCIRPQQAEAVLKQIASLGQGAKQVISILAGIRPAYYEKFLGAVPLVWAMPNLPAAVGEGMTILSFNHHSTTDFRSAVNLIFQSMGSVVELPENLMDLATGIAGSAPAYIFSFIEAAARLGEKEGIPYDKALKMAAQTFLGSAKILLQEETPVGQLIQQIAVPNGTTEAGLKVFQETEIGKHFQEVIKAVARRSEELSRSFSH